MQSIFFDYGIEILTNGLRYFIRYDDGEIVEHFNEVEVSQTDAMIAQKGPQEAYKIILKYQNGHI